MLRTVSTLAVHDRIPLSKPLSTSSLRRCQIQLERRKNWRGTVILCTISQEEIQPCKEVGRTCQQARAPTPRISALHRVSVALRSRFIDNKPSIIHPNRNGTVVIPAAPQSALAPLAIPEMSSSQPSSKSALDKPDQWSGPAARKFDTYDAPANSPSLLPRHSHTR